jgi:hypothetical protein
VFVLARLAAGRRPIISRFPVCGFRCLERAWSERIRPDREISQRQNSVKTASKRSLFYIYRQFTAHLQHSTKQSRHLRPCAPALRRRPLFVCFPDSIHLLTIHRPSPSPGSANRSPCRSLLIIVITIQHHGHGHGHCKRLRAPVHLRCSLQRSEPPGPHDWLDRQTQTTNNPPNPIT